MQPQSTQETYRTTTFINAQVCYCVVRVQVVVQYIVWQIKPPGDVELYNDYPSQYKSRQRTIGAQKHEYLCSLLAAPVGGDQTRHKKRNNSSPSTTIAHSLFSCALAHVFLSMLDTTTTCFERLDATERGLVSIYALLFASDAPRRFSATAAAASSDHNNNNESK